MKRFTLLLVLVTLVIPCAAPSGAVFALEEIDTMVESAPETVELSVSKTISTIEPEVPPAQPSVIETHEVPFPVDVSPPHGAENLTVGSGGAVSSATTEPEIIKFETPPTPYPNLAISELQVDGTCDGGSWCTKLGDNVEFIELYNPTGSEVSLEGWKLRRQATGSTSQPTDYVTFGKTGIFPGEYILVASGLTASEDGVIITPLPSSLSNTGGSLFLVAPDGTVIDMVGWGASAKSFYAAPAKAPVANQSIQRCVRDGVLSTAEPRNNAEEMLLYADLGPTPGVGVLCIESPIINTCAGVGISEIAANVDEQFIELHNPTAEPIALDGCRVLTNRSTTKFFAFPEATTLESGEFITVPIIDTDLALTKTTTGIVYLVSSDGLEEVDAVTYANVAKATSWALIGGKWVQTYEMTPAAANSYQQYPACEVGYVRNLETGKCNKIAEPAVAPADCGEGRERNSETGRCRSIPAPKEYAPCTEGQYRSEETNRCRSIVLAVASVLKPCADDQFRNPVTNRCKSIASSDDVALADCGEGRERNPETNRCRNILLSSPPEAAFAVEPTKESAAAFTGWWILGGIAAAGAGYGIWEWRYELAAGVRRVMRFTTHSK